MSDIQAQETKPVTIQTEEMNKAPRSTGFCDRKLEKPLPQGREEPKFILSQKSIRTKISAGCFQSQTASLLRYTRI